MRTIIEAARWAPSASNLQPWRFFYALHGTPEFDTFLDLLVPGNQAWAKNAGALLILASKTTNLPAGSDTPVTDAQPFFRYGRSLGLFCARSATARLGDACDGRLRCRAHGTGAEPAGRFSTRGGHCRRPQMRSEYFAGDPRAREIPNGRKPQSEFTFKGGFPA